MRAVLVCAVAVGLVLPATAVAGVVGDANVAALQVGLRAESLYDGDVDGFAGPQTLTALRRLAGASTPLSAQTRAALGVFGANTLGSRPLVTGLSGWDVAALQFLLAWHGFPSGTLDGAFGMRTDAAVRRFQLWSGIPAIGVAGPQTLAALRAAPPASPIRLSAPVSVAPTDEFGPRGARFHAGIDYPAPSGTAVAAAGDGVVVDAGWREGFGRLIVLEHEQGVTSWYAHLSEVLVRPGQRVTAGATIGRVGATGHATGPHLHFEVHVRGAAVDPLAAIR